MTRPEKRWQLLLVADDGRIIPFKRIKGVAVTLMVLLALAGLACAVLAWQLTAERIRHGRTRDRLADAQRLAEHYKSEHELIAAELVVAEARMEKAGMPVAQRELRTPRQPAPIEAPAMAAAPPQEAPETTVTPAAPTPDAAPDLAAAPVPGQEAPQPTPAVDTGDSTSTDAAGDRAKSPPEPSQKTAETVSDPKASVVGLGDLTVTLDTARQILTARYRVKNNGPRSSPIAGRCVVVLKGGRLEPAEWVAMPTVALTDGKPDGRQGQAFKISRFKNMTARSTWQSDPSVFDTASVYVFDDKANLLLVEDYPVDLPALPPSSDVEPERSDASSPEPAADPSGDGSAGSASPPARGAGEAASAPAVGISGSAPGGTLPSPAGEDPSLVDVKPPATRNDSRSRF